MIDLYYWTTPNGHKITLFLAEAGAPYSIKPVNISTGEQFKPEFLKISPNNRIPAIVDTEPADGKGPLSVFESGAILQYLAEKTGKFLPADARARSEVMQWLFWQMGGLGPMAGQNGHFNNYAPEKIPYAIDRYIKETERLYGVLDERLEGAISSPAGDCASEGKRGLYRLARRRSPIDSPHSFRAHRRDCADDLLVGNDETWADD